jgi:hypothetical protein
MQEHEFVRFANECSLGAHFQHPLWVKVNKLIPIAFQVVNLYN